MESLMNGDTDYEAVITETPESPTTSTVNTVYEAVITETPSSTTASCSENTGIQSPAIVEMEMENNNLSLVRVKEQNERRSLHPMITRSYRHISGRRPLHSPGARMSFQSLINLTPKKLTSKKNVSKRYTPKARARGTPTVPKTPRPKSTPKKTPRVGRRSSETSRLEHAPGAVTRRRSLYDSHFRARGEKRSRNEDLTGGNPNVSDHLVPSPHKKVRYSPIPSPNPIEVSSGHQSDSLIIGTNSLPETSHDNAQGSFENVEPEGSQGQSSSDLKNIQSSVEEEPTDSMTEADIELIVDRYIRSTINSIGDRVDISIPERTPTPSNVSTSIDPIEITETTFTEPSPKTKKSMCVLM